MIWPSVISGMAAIIAAVFGLFIRTKLAEIHVLVNSRLSEALDQIRELKETVKFEKTQMPEDKT